MLSALTGESPSDSGDVDYAPGDESAEDGPAVSQVGSPRPCLLVRCRLVLWRPTLLMQGHAWLLWLSSLCLMQSCQAPARLFLLRVASKVGTPRVSHSKVLHASQATLTLYAGAIAGAGGCTCSHAAAPGRPSGSAVRPQQASP